MNEYFFCCFWPGLMMLAILVFTLKIIEKQKQKQKQRQAQILFDEMRSIFAKARKGEITKSDSDKFFDCADEALTLMPSQPAMNSKMAFLKKEIDNMSSQMTMILAVRSPAASLGDEIDKLAALRQNGMISDFEFKAFSERFKLSTGEKASDIIKAISKLSEQRKQGAMLEGNYHAALWSLLDKLDRKT